MSVILAVGDELGREVGRHVPGVKVPFHGANLAGVPPKDWAAEGPYQLVELIANVDPTVIVVDVRMGGQQYRVIDGVRFAAQNRREPPAIVLVSPWESLQLLRYANDLGAYTVVDLIGRRDARRIADAVLDATAWKLGDPDASWRPLQERIRRAHDGASRVSPRGQRRHDA